MKPCTKCSCSGTYVDYAGPGMYLAVPCSACQGNGWVAPECFHVYVQDRSNTLVTWRCWKCGDVKHGFSEHQTVYLSGTVFTYPAIAYAAGVTWHLG